YCLLPGERDSGVISGALCCCVLISIMISVMTQTLSVPYGRINSDLANMKEDDTDQDDDCDPNTSHLSELKHDSLLPDLILSTTPDKATKTSAPRRHRSLLSASRSLKFAMGACGRHLPDMGACGRQLPTMGASGRHLPCDLLLIQRDIEKRVLRIVGRDLRFIADKFYNDKAKTMNLDAIALLTFTHCLRTSILALLYWRISKKFS
ncbi:unnamed protein product, partial [Meganyctiphanes norvegica]